MSVGKDSILRAANADAKTTEVKAEAKTAEEVKAPAKAEAAKAPAAKKAPAKRTAAQKTTTAKKTTTTKKTTTRKKAVKTSVLTPQNSEELQAAFVKNAEPETVAGPVHINEDLPVFLL